MAESGTPPESVKSAVQKIDQKAVAELFPEGIFERNLDYTGLTSVKYALVETSFEDRETKEEIVIPAGFSVKYTRSSGSYTARFPALQVLSLRNILNDPTIVSLLKEQAKAELSDTSGILD